MRFKSLDRRSVKVPGVSQDEKILESIWYIELFSLRENILVIIGDLLSK